MDSSQPPPDTGFVVANHFLDQLRVYLKHADESDRPVSVENSRLLCEHDLLLYDLNDATELNRGSSPPVPFDFCDFSLGSQEEWQFLFAK